MAHVDNFNAVIRGAVYDDVTGPWNHEAAVIWPEFRASYPHVWLVRESEALALDAVQEAKSICRVALSDIVVDLPKVLTSFGREDAKTHASGV